MMSANRWFLAATVALLCSPQFLRAAYVHNSTGLVGPVRTITFNELQFVENTALTNQYADLYSDHQGVTFTSTLFYDAAKSAALPVSTNITGNWAGNFTYNINTATGVGSWSVPNDPFSIHFSQPVTAAAFALATNDGGTTVFTARLHGAVVDRFQSSTDLASTNDYFGFSGFAFDEILVDVNGSHYAVIDNIQLQPGLTSVAEPSTAVLAAMAVGSFFLLRRRWI